MAYKRILVTTALPYTNGPLHLGHMAGTFIPADIFVRFHRLLGTDILWIGGSDEHGIPIILRAENEKITPQQVVDRYYEMHIDALKKCHISLDHYSRTSRPIHHKLAQEFFLDMERKGILVKKKEKMYFDEKLQIFLADRYLQGECPNCHFLEANGDQCESCGTYLNSMQLINPKSKLSSEVPILKETLHWYFPLGKYQKELQEFINSKHNSFRKNVIKYSQTWLNDGLEDRAITRDISWGVPVPLEEDEAKGKVLYVWFDAVLGYISSTIEWAKEKGKPEEWRTYWQDEETELIHFIGKDNVVFHALMFPAMLIAKNEGSKEKYVYVNRIPASEFMNIEGKKFSKSRGYAIYLHEMLEEYPSDVVRYMIATNYPESHDTDFSWNDFQNRVNGELADTLGNFVKRAIDFCNSKFGGEVPADAVGKEHEVFGDEWDNLINKIEESYLNIQIKTSLFETMSLARMANRYFTEKEPWKEFKTNKDASAFTTAVGLNLCYTLAIIFSPIIPETSRKILMMLGFDENVKITWEMAKKFSLPKGHKVYPKTEPLFQKIEHAQIEKEIAKIEKLVNLQKDKSMESKEMKTDVQAQPATENKVEIKATTKTEQLSTISYDDFMKVDLRTGTILSVEKVEKADKLYKMKVKIGEEERQILSGIAEHYSPEGLLHKNVIVVANLAPKKIRGLESHGMLLAVENNDNKVFVIFPEGENINGTRVH